MNGALSAFTANPEKMDETIQAVANFDFQEAKRHFWNFFIRLQNKIATFDISDFFDSIGVAQVGYFIGSIVELIVEILIGAITFGASTVASITAKLGKVFETIVGTILSIIRKFYNITKNITVDTATFFLNILRKGADEFGKLMDEIWEAIKKWLDNLFVKGKKSLLKDFESGKIKGDVDEKGKKRAKGDQTRYSNYAEMKIDDYFETQTFRIGGNKGKLKRVSSRTVKTFDDKIVSGIDGIYEFSSPPPKYIISEVKYNKATLSKEVTKSGGSQMSKKWVKYHLEFGAVSQEVKDDILIYGYESLLCNVSKAGKVTNYSIKQTSAKATKDVSWRGKVI